jgi:hypothetical protein
MKIMRRRNGTLSRRELALPRNPQANLNYAWNDRKGLVPYSHTYKATSLAKWIQKGKPGLKTRRFRQRGGRYGLADFLPTTVWGNWNIPGALQTGPQLSNPQAGLIGSSTLPAPLANGGLYTGPQSTGAWASTPMPPTQWAHQIQAAATAKTPDVWWHQRPNDNFGASFSPAWK